VGRILEGVGLPVERSGRTIATGASDRSIALGGRSGRAWLNGGPFRLDSASAEIAGVVYAPLRFFTAGLGAQATYRPALRAVSVVSQTVGRSAIAFSLGGGAREYKGIVEALDMDSQPPSITVTSGASVKTIPVSSTARVDVTDVVANVTRTGTLEDIHVGDYARITVRKGGAVERVVDAFASRHGKVAAIAGNTILLGDGHVIVPTGVTSLSLNGEGGKVADLQVGDVVNVRYNLDTSEVREILATRRAAPGSAKSAGAVAIASIVASVNHPLRAGDSFAVVMRGTPGGAASYDIGPYFTGLPMRESAPGVYSARYTIPRGANFGSAPLFGHLSVGSGPAARAQSEIELSAASPSPGIGDVAPDDGQLVNNPQPSIYATFAPGAVTVNASSVSLIVNGHDVTASALRTASFIEYHPLLTYGDGPVHVVVRVSDLAGNTASKTWTFTIRAR